MYARPLVKRRKDPSGDGGCEVQVHMHGRASGVKLLVLSNLYNKTLAGHPR